MRYGLIGKSLKHSLSGSIHKIFFDETGKKGDYEYYELQEENLEKALNEFQAQGIKGLNVTIPYKIKMMEYLDQISDEAMEIGSINTISLLSGIKTGYNTDYLGFSMMMDHFSIDATGRDCVVLGSGGASKAVIKYLKDKRASSITIVTRDKRALTNNENNIITYDELIINPILDIIVNTTPVGMYPNNMDSPIPYETVKKARAVVDIIYNPLETKLLSYAKQEGLIWANGLYMLVGQAIASQEIWNNEVYSKELFQLIYKKLLVKLETEI